MNSEELSAQVCGLRSYSQQTRETTV